MAQEWSIIHGTQTLRATLLHLPDTGGFCMDLQADGMENNLMEDRLVVISSI
jgi:hypothetical protein